MSKLVAQMKSRGEKSLAVNHAPPRRYGTAFHLNPPVTDLRLLAVGARKNKTEPVNFSLASDEDIRRLRQIDLADPYLAWLMAHIDQGPAQFIHVPAGQTVQRHRRGSGLTFIVLENASSLLLENLITQEDIAINRVMVWQKEQSSLRYVQLCGLNNFLADGVKIELLGRQATATVTQLNYSRGSGQADIETSIFHRAKATTSQIQVRSAGAGRSTTIYRGLIDVDKTAPGTIGWQGGRALILSRQATVGILPRLDIRTNDVRCSHGVSATHLDDAVLFYMHTRGLSARQARQLALAGFMRQQLDLSSLLAKQLNNILRYDE